jgi:gamma-glutamylcyclotransferase (GGCT)/AIG2-like uncharacterized protein YtfP
MTVPDLLFVYGSLRPGAGHAMGHWLAGFADPEGPAWLAGAVLYRVSWYPGIAAGEGRVRGDLFRLHDAAAALRELDDFEEMRGRASDEYERRLGTVARADGSTVTAWAYWYRQAVQELARVDSGDWLAP